MQVVIEWIQDNTDFLVVLGIALFVIGIPTATYHTTANPMTLPWFMRALAIKNWIWGIIAIGGGIGIGYLINKKGGD